MMNFDDDIEEYSQTVDKLQKENLALKAALSRYLVFGGYSQFSALEGDLYSQLKYTENALQSCFENLLIPAVAGTLVDGRNGIPDDFLFMRVNQEFADFCGLEIREIIGKKKSELGILESPLWLEAVLKSTKILEPVTVKINDCGRDLEVRVNSLEHSSFFIQFRLASEDTSRDKKIREDLKFIHTLINALPVPLFYKDTAGHYLLCNDSYTALTGISAEDISGKTAGDLEDYFSKEYADFYQDKDLQLVKDQGVQVYESPVRCTDGQVRVYIVTKKIVHNSYGNPGILGVMQNIDEMLKARKKLAESENRYKTLFNAINQPIIVVDGEGNIILCNSTAVELFEEDPETKKIPADGFIDIDIVKNVIETGEAFTKRVCVTVNSQERWFVSTMQPVNDSFGERVVQIISNDITELKRYQTDLLKQKAVIEDSNNLKSIFLANIAHETRTPANIICGNVQMIQAGIHPEKLDTFLTAIYKNSRKLLDIIDDIVELSKIESGQVKLRHEICSINSILEEALVYLEDVLVESGKKIDISLSGTVDDYESLIYADNQYIGQVFKKLIVNAVTFTSEGFIKIGARIEDSKIVFYVSDSGIGIPPSKLKIIFERFRQADEGSARQYGGTGLGLAIAGELVKRMDGTFNVESVVDKGSTFSFMIPYRRAGM